MQKTIFLAPHLTFPPRGGGEKRSWHLYNQFIASGGKGECICQHGLISSSELNKFKVKKNWRDSKAMVAALSLLSGKDYWRVKMFRPEVMNALKNIKNYEYNTVVVNFLYSYPLVKSFCGRKIPLIVDTHNYDPDYYNSIGNATGNPLLRALCNRAVQNSLETLKNLPVGTTLVHVSHSDALRYETHRPDLEHFVIENGTNINPRKAIPANNEPVKKIIFVGALSARINQDALEHFSIRFWPHLKSRAHLTVIGSNPSKSIMQLCRREKWDLKANVSEIELEAQYESCHAAILPFKYGEGSKLKLLEACGRGVPVLTTSSGTTGMSALPPLVISSDNPTEWRLILDRFESFSSTDINETIEYARNFSWQHLGKKYFELVETICRISK